ncbi:MAG: GYF domain-containing protein [Planctomycetes bacterium]|jgi:hypothetical protein|nr:GYF domain-containing protein [Planctomycetota bacterium]
MTQWYCAVGGQKFGPMPFEDLSRWAAEGRLSDRDLVWGEGMAEWVAAGSVAGLFAASSPPPPPLPSGMGGGVSGAGGFVEPHRGGAVLVLGILGILVCVICGIVAWVMGNTDLAKMREGRMDRTGEGMTQAGRILGIVSVVLGIIGLVVAVIVLSAGGLAGPAWR